MCRKERLPGARWLEWIHPDDRERAIQPWAQSVESGQPYETTFRLKRGEDSSWRWHLVRALPLTGPNGEVAQWFGTCTDIEDQKQADSKLHQQWQTFDTALSHTPDFTYTFDLSGRFTYVNRALLSLLQKSLEDACGKNFFDLEYPPELAGRLQLQIQQVIDTRQPVRDRTEFTGPTGETRFYEYIFVPVLDSPAASAPWQALRVILRSRTWPRNRSRTTAGAGANFSKNSGGHRSAARSRAHF